MRTKWLALQGKLQWLFEMAGLTVGDEQNPFIENAQLKDLLMVTNYRKGHHQKEASAHIQRARCPQMSMEWDLKKPIWGGQLLNSIFSMSRQFHPAWELQGLEYCGDLNLKPLIKRKRNFYERDDERKTLWSSDHWEKTWNGWMNHSVWQMQRASPSESLFLTLKCIVAACCSKCSTFESF